MKKPKNAQKQLKKWAELEELELNNLYSSLHLVYAKHALRFCRGAEKVRKMRIEQ